MIWEQGHRQVMATEFAAWLAAYPRPLTLEVRESPTGFTLHMYLDAGLLDLAGRPRCVGSIQPSTSPTIGPIYRVHGEPMKREQPA